MISDSCYQPEPKYTELPCYKAGYKRRRALADCSMNVKSLLGKAMLHVKRFFAISFFLQDRRAFAKFEKEQQNAKCVMVCLKNVVFYVIMFTLQNEISKGLCIETIGRQHPLN